MPPTPLLRGIHRKRRLRGGPHPQGGPRAEQQRPQVQGPFPAGRDPLAVCTHRGDDGVYEHLLRYGGEAEPPSARCHAPRVHFGPEHDDGAVASPHRFQTLKQALPVVEDGGGGVHRDGPQGPQPAAAPLPGPRLCALAGAGQRVRGRGNKHGLCFDSVETEAESIPVHAVVRRQRDWYQFV